MQLNLLSTAAVVSANGDIARSDKAADDRSGDGFEEDTDMSTPLIPDSHQHRWKFKMEDRHVYVDGKLYSMDCPH